MSESPEIKSPDPQPQIDPAGLDIRLVALDLDGTLIRSDKKLSKVTVQAIRRCSERGVRVVLASSRPPRSVKQIYELLQLSTYSIHYNGALVLDPIRRKVVLRQQLDPQDMLEIIEQIRWVAPKCLIRVDMEDRWVTDQVGFSDNPAADGAPVPDGIGPFEKILTEPANRIAVVAQVDALQQIRNMMKTRFSGGFQFAHSNPRVLQIIHPFADKQSALEWVARHYGVEQKQVMAVGDAPNDNEMLSWAGLGVAMGNALESTRHVANVSVPSNDEDGVAHAILKYVLKAEKGDSGAPDS